MRTLTARGVLILGKRLDWSWRGTAAQHMAHLTRVSPGSDRPTIVPWGALKTRPTAAPNERPPGRQTSTLTITTLRTAVTEPPMLPEFRTSVTRGSDKQNPNAREPHHRFRNDKIATSNAGDTDLWQTTLITNNALPPIAPTDPPPREHNTPQRYLQTNRCQSKPLCASWVQGKRKHAPTDHPREVPGNAVEKAPPPFPFRTAVATTLISPELRTSTTPGSDKQNPSAREPPHRTKNDKNATSNAGDTDLGQTTLITNNALPPIAPTDPPSREHNTPQRHLQTDCCQSKPLCAPWAQGKRKHAPTDQPREVPVNSVEKAPPPSPLKLYQFSGGTEITPPKLRSHCLITIQPYHPTPSHSQPPVYASQTLTTM